MRVSAFTTSLRAMGAGAAWGRLVAALGAEERP